MKAFGLVLTTISLLLSGINILVGEPSFMSLLVFSVSGVAWKDSLTKCS